jgi:hypothetical protein
MAEKAQESQIKITENAQLFLRRDVMRSHYLGAGISVLAVICSAVCGVTGNPTAAVALVGIPVMAVARALISRHSPAETEKTDETESKPSAPSQPPASA